MSEETTAPLVVENTHSGERLEMVRRPWQGGEELSFRGYLPAGGAGLPLHAHLLQEEGVEVVRGRLGAIVSGRQVELGAGETLTIEPGRTHRWWNAGEEPLEFEAWARPAGDLDRYLQAVFQVRNAGAPGKPPLVYLAHVMVRHGASQQLRMVTGALQSLTFRLALLAGRLTGRYRGSGWPGAPEGCTGAPRVEVEEA
jgi:mannose-6-phosphate isomerase-like protein (cupin superfamily)